MAAYNILEARNNLSRLIADVESGLEVTIMRRGKPVAKIVPAGADDAPQRGSGAAIAAWLEANALPLERRRSSDEIEADIRELREAGA